MGSSGQMEGEMVLKSGLREGDDRSFASGAREGGLGWGAPEDDLLSWEREMDILDCVTSPRIQLK